MAEFMTEVVEVKDIREIEGADRVEIAIVHDYQCIVKKGLYKPGDLVAYIQEGSVVPDDLLEELGLKGRLAGRQKNRVRAIRLLGVLSQGIVYPARDTWLLGDDVSEELGIIKYEPKDRRQFNTNAVRVRGDYNTPRYDIENIKKYRYVLEQLEDQIVITEKIHGSWCCLISWGDGTKSVTSKGLSKYGNVISTDDPDNPWVRLLSETELDLPNDHPVYIMGELYGPKMQDLKYGDEQGFRVFDVYIGNYGHGEYLPFPLVQLFCEVYGFETVPVLYAGPYDPDIVSELTDGQETVSGDEKHIREGVVVRSLHEAFHPRLGRIMVKSVSEAYLTRKNGTEYN